MFWGEEGIRYFDVNVHFPYLKILHAIIYAAFTRFIVGHNWKIPQEKGREIWKDVYFEFPNWI